MTWRTAVRQMTHTISAAVLAVGLLVGSADAAGIVTTGLGSNQVIVYPTPNANSPNPAAVPVSGLPAGAAPGGIACFADTCLVADTGNFRVLVVRVSTTSVVDVINTAATFPNIGYSGAGTIAVNPAGTFALAVEPFVFQGQITVIAAPFNSASAINKVPLVGAGVGQAGTQSIAFHPDGRAFVCTGGGIAVLNAPYTAVAFTIPLPSGCRELALSPNASTLFAP